MKANIGYLLLVAALLFSCKKEENKESVSELTPPKAVISFSGDTLVQKSFPDSIYQVLKSNMESAKTLSEQFPDSSELAIWYGRRVAYMGRYHESIVVFSVAIEKFPNDYRLLRHRGHRYLTTRQVDLAVKDFEKANALSLNAENAIEPDGIPNKLNQPLGNDKFNVYYHQGLAYYLKGEFEKAVPIYERSLFVSDNDDLFVATTYWQFMTLHRLGRVEEANALLLNLSDQLTIIENDVYLNLLMLFKGTQSDEELMKKAMNSNGIGNPTMLYGIGNGHLQQGNREEAKRIWNEALNQKSWDSFGYIAAEAELQRAQP